MPYHRGMVLMSQVYVLWFFLTWMTRIHRDERHGAMDYSGGS